MEIAVKKIEIEDEQKDIISRNLNILKDKTKPLNKIRREMEELKKKKDAIKARMKELEEKLFEIDGEAKFAVTHHAVERFQERIADISCSRIKSILKNHKGLKAVYVKKGAGEYSIFSYRVKVRIENATILTVIGMTPREEITLEEKFRLLSEYAVYCADMYIREYRGETVFKMSFDTFIKETWIPKSLEKYL